VSGAAAPRRIELALVGLLFALAAASYPYAMLVVDSGRDLAWGQAIAAGEAWPLYGPSLNNLWRLGPLWFYLLALPFALGATLGGVALAIGLLAAAKIPLAYALGRRWQDPAFGLACAAAIALPGWSTFGQLVLLHTSVVETAVLATLLLALRAWQAPRPAPALAAALLLGVALHAHPTALVAAPAVALALLRVARRGAPRVLLLAPLCFLLPFLPMLWAEARAGWPQWQATLGYAGDSDALARLARAPALLRGLTFGGVEFSRDFLLARWPWLAAGYALTAALAGVLALAGLVLALRRQPPARALLALAGLAGLLVLLLRDTTPEWMTYALAPFGAALLAQGWLAPWPATTRAWLARGVGLLAALVSTAVLIDRHRVALEGLQALPGAAISDVAQAPRADATPRFWLPAWGQDALARRLCADPLPVALHGDLATALHFGQGVALQRHCRRATTVRLGGGASRQLAGVPSALAASLGLSGEPTPWGFLLLTRIDALHPAQGVEVRRHTRYLLDDYLPRLRAGERHRIALERACRPGDLLVATNLLPLLNEPFALRTPDGRVPTPRARGIASAYFDCPPDGRFALQLEVLDPLAADVFVLRRD
jgi:hypothetical protein